MVTKRILVPTRLRRPPATGWSWVDRRFAARAQPSVSRDAVLMYFFLTAVADQNGLSFYGDGTLAALLRMSLPDLVQARDELLAHDLIAHESRFDPGLLPAAARPAPPLGAGPRAGATGRTVAPGHGAAAFPGGRGPAMNVGLWAEIRRLAEIEKLSGWAIARRLHCSRHTVAAALKLDQPPTLPSHCAAPASWTHTGPRSTPWWPSVPNSRRCGSARKSVVARTAIRAAQSSFAAISAPSVPPRAGLPGSPLRAGPGDADRLG